MDKDIKSRFNTEADLIAADDIKELGSEAAVRSHKPAPSGFIDVPCKVLHETDKAVLVSIDHHIKDFWFPLSQVCYIYRKFPLGDINPKFTDRVYVKSWLIDKNGIEL